MRYWIDVAPTTPGGRRVVAVEPADAAASSRPATPLDASAAALSASFLLPRGVVPRVRVRFADGGEANFAPPPL